MLLLQIDVQLFGECRALIDSHVLMIIIIISCACVQMSLAWIAMRSEKSFLPRSMS
jgi:hypothetical protein